MTVEELFVEGELIVDAGREGDEKVISKDNKMFMVCLCNGMFYKINLSPCELISIITAYFPVYARAE